MPALLAPVILGPVPRILWKQGINQVNKFALLFKKSMFTEDSRDKPENDWCRGRWLSVCCESVKRMYHSGSSANELSLKAKDDVSCFNFKHWFSTVCSAFKHPSPADKSATSPSGGEVKNNALHKGLDVVRQYAALLERGVQCSTRVKKALVETRQAPLFSRLRSQCAPDAKGFLSDVYKRSTLAKKLPADGVQCGRSMIEMLGVLAIIAVLTTAGIAGYSKAMEKYKLIKYREGMVELISNFIHIKDELKFDSGENTWTTNYPEIMQAMGLIPNEFEVTNPTTLKDKFGHTMQIFHDGRPGENHFNFSFNFANSRISSLVCHELLETVIEFRNDVWELYRQPWGVPDGADYIPYYHLLGSNYCGNGIKCMSNLTMSDIHEICYYYKGKPETYRYAIQFNFKV